MSFAHLHTHSHYSLLESPAKVNDILDRVKELGMDTIAVTEYANLYSAVEFTIMAKERGMHVIIGCELFVSSLPIDDVAAHSAAIHNLTVLATNTTGYKNLMHLITTAQLDGLLSKPCVDKKLLRERHEGLIALSGCLEGEIPQCIIKNDPTGAKRVALEYQEIFGKDNFYFELQHHPRVPEQEHVNRELKRLSKEIEIPLVATADIHYVHPEDAPIQDLLLCIKDNRKEYENDRRTMADFDLYIKSEQEMREAFSDTPEAIDNTVTIANQCDFKITLGEIQLPHYPLPKGETPMSSLRALAEKGMKKRFNGTITPEYRERLEYELSVIEKMGYPEYFLIVQDFINWARDNGIVVGPGRGSAAGSFVSYLVGITNIDPIKYSLLFERFLNPERVSMPDVDMDFADDRRDDVLAYCREKYGWDHVAHIITFGTMAARAAIRDVGRAMGMSYGFCDQIAKLIPMFSSIDGALENVPDFKNLYGANDDAKRLIDGAKRLEGVCRHASVHACGVVITKDPVVEYTPVQRVSGDDEHSICTQYSSSTKTSYVEKIGLLKMDFLGLKNLTIIQNTLRIIKKIHNVSIDIETLPLDDEKTYALLQRGETTGVFQLESSGMKRYLKLLKPTVFEDIVAMVALYRPGPMDWIPDFIAGKHGTKKVKYLHPKLEPILRNTYGVAVYQEQVMQIAQALAGFSLGEADILRKAMGKKILELIKEQREKFVAGCETTGVGKKIGEKVFQFIEPFAGYGFNRCLIGSTTVVDSKTGKFFSLQEIANLNDQGKRLPSLFSLNDKQKLQTKEIQHVYKNGRKKVFTITTRLGKKITATTNHPFRTFSGWKNLGDLSVGNRIAVARAIRPSRHIKIEEYKVALVGYLLAEGNLCHPHGFYFYSTNNKELDDYESHLTKFKNTKATRNNSKSAISIYAGRKDLRKPSEAVEWIRKIGMYGKTATEKHFPNFVFTLSTKQLSLLIGKMFQGDGCISITRQDPQIFYATSSERLAREMQHLLLRLDITSTLHIKKFKYPGGIKIGYTITINRYSNITSFANGPGQHLIGEKQKNLNKALKKHHVLNGLVAIGSARGSKDILPIEILPLIKKKILSAGFALRTFARQNNIAERLLFSDKSKKGLLRETVQKIATFLHDAELLEVSSSDVYWDEIVSIAPAGTEETYDLTIEGTHNFLANDIVVHNSHAACYALIGYQTAYLKAHYPTEFMAALLTSDQSNSDRVAIEVSECRDMDITVLPPNINESFEEFAVIKQNTLDQPQKTTATPEQDALPQVIRFGLNAIKNVGHPVAKAIVTERKRNGEFTSIANLIERVRSHDLNKRSLESLAKVGAFDGIAERNEVLTNIDSILNFIKVLSSQNNTEQSSLFDGSSVAPPTIYLKKSTPASKKDLLDWEKQLLGLYVSDHPTREYEEYLDRTTHRLDQLSHDMIDDTITIGGIITGGKKIFLKDQKQMYFAMVENTRGKIECVVFPRTYEQTASSWENDRLVRVQGKLSDKDGQYKILAESVQALSSDEVTTLKRIEATRKKYAKDKEDASSEDDSTKPFTITIPTGTSKETLHTLSETLRTLPTGDTPVVLRINGKEMKTSFKIERTEESEKILKEVFVDTQPVAHN